MNQIAELTDEQQAQIEVYRNRYFDLATSTVTDRDKAESSVIQLGLPGRTIIWVDSPEEVSQVFGQQSFPTRDRDSWRHSLLSPVYRTLMSSFAAHWCSAVLRSSLWYSFQNRLRIRSPLSMRRLLESSVLDTFWDVGWICFHTYCYEVLGVDHTPVGERSSLYLCTVLIGSCSGVWLLPGKIIILRRPTTVLIESTGVCCYF